MSPRLDNFENLDFDRGRSSIVESLWVLVQALIFSSFIPGSSFRRLLLRCFGASVGNKVIIKPGVRIKFPWKLSVGDHSWIGESVWIDNLAPVSIGAHCCLSQQAYICTGNHDWGHATFKLMTAPVTIGDGAWIAARAMVCPGRTIGEGAVLCMGSVAASDLPPWSIAAGVPAKITGMRTITDNMDRQAKQ